jgi:endonuclease YncB( thermonuclease family)
MQRFLLALVASTLLGALFAAPASAQFPGTAVGPCPGATHETCDLWKGKVTFIGDGDTLSVNVFGDGTKKPVRVRVTGIDAMEETYYTNNPNDRTGECHANEATARLEHLVKRGKGRVQLAAQDYESRSNSRWKREVSVKINGVWRDIGRIMVNEGHAIWLAGKSEWAWNADYAILAQRAAERRVGIWNPDYCAAGPGDTSLIRIWALGNPEQKGIAEVDGEWIRVKNLDPVNVLGVGGWWVRDSGHRRYVFPPWTLIMPGRTITVHVGAGEDTAEDFFWGLERPPFNNPSAPRARGDAAFLFDYQGDLRAWMQYPCTYNCSDPNQGALEIDPAYKRNKEFVRVRNVGPASLDLEGYRIYTKPYTYAFGADSVVNPGETMRVNVQGDPAGDTRLVKNWGKDHNVLNDGGDRVDVSTFSYVTLACQAWGTKSC